MAITELDEFAAVDSELGFATEEDEFASVDAEIGVATAPTPPMPYGTVMPGAEHPAPYEGPKPVEITRQPAMTGYPELPGFQTEQPSTTAVSAGYKEPRAIPSEEPGIPELVGKAVAVGTSRVAAAKARTTGALIRNIPVAEPYDPKNERHKAMVESGRELAKKRDDIVSRTSTASPEFANFRKSLTTDQKQAIQFYDSHSREVEGKTPDWETKQNKALLDFEKKIVTTVPGKAMRLAGAIDGVIPDEWKQQVSQVSNEDLSPKRILKDPGGWLKTALTQTAQQIPILADQAITTAIGNVVLPGAGGFVAGTASMIGLETSGFIEQADEYGKTLTPEEQKQWQQITDKYAFQYGTAAGIVEYMGNAFGALGPLKSLTGAAKKEILKTVLTRGAGIIGEGAEELTQAGLENLYMQKAIDEMKAVKPDFSPAFKKQDLKQAALSGAVASFFLTGPGAGLEVARGVGTARAEAAKPPLDTSLKVDVAMQQPVAKPQQPPTPPETPQGATPTPTPAATPQQPQTPVAAPAAKPKTPAETLDEKLESGSEESLTDEESAIMLAGDEGDVEQKNEKADEEQKQREEAYKKAQAKIKDRQPANVDELLSPDLLAKQSMSGATPEQRAEFDALQEVSRNKILYSPGSSGPGTGEGVAGRTAWDWTVRQATKPENRQKYGDPVIVLYDMGNQGGGNKYLPGGHEGMNQVIWDTGRIMHDNLQGISPNVKLVHDKTGGDEAGFMVYGATEEQVNDAVVKAKKEIDKYRQENNMMDQPHPKHAGLRTGVGYIGVGVGSTVNIEKVKKALSEDGVSFKDDAQAILKYVDMQSENDSNTYLESLAEPQGFVKDVETKTYSNRMQSLTKQLTSDVISGIISTEEATRRFKDALEKEAKHGKGQGSKTGGNLAGGTGNGDTPSGGTGPAGKKPTAAIPEAVSGGTITGYQAGSWRALRFTPEVEAMEPAQKREAVAAERKRLREKARSGKIPDTVKRELREADKVLGQYLRKKLGEVTAEKRIEAESKAVGKYAETGKPGNEKLRKLDADVKTVINDLDNADLVKALNDRYGEKTIQKARDAIETGNKDGKAAQELRDTIANILLGANTQEAVEMLQARQEQKVEEELVGAERRDRERRQAEGKAPEGEERRKGERRAEGPSPAFQERRENVPEGKKRGRNLASRQRAKESIGLIRQRTIRAIPILSLQMEIEVAPLVLSWRSKGAEAAADAVGKSVVWFKVKPNTSFAKKNPGGFYIPSLPDYIYLNVDEMGRTGFMGSVMHELTHAVKNEAPEIYQTYLNVLESELTERGKERREETKQELGNADIGAEEFIAELNGDIATSESFWRKLYERSPDAFQRVYEILQRIIAEVKGYLSGAKYPKFYVRRLERVEQALIDMVEKFRAQRGDGGQGGVTFQGRGENAPRRMSGFQLTPDGLVEVETDAMLVKTTPEIDTKRGVTEDIPRGDLNKGVAQHAKEVYNTTILKIKPESLIRYEKESELLDKIGSVFGNIPESRFTELDDGESFHDEQEEFWYGQATNHSADLQYAARNRYAEEVASILKEIRDNYKVARRLWGPEAISPAPRREVLDTGTRIPVRPTKVVAPNIGNLPLFENQDIPGSQMTMFQRRSAIATESEDAARKAAAAEGAAAPFAVAAEVQTEANRLRGKLANMGTDRLLDRAQIELQIKDYKDVNRDIIGAAIIDYAKKIGIRGEPYANVDTLVKNAKTKNDLLKAIDTIDERWNRMLNRTLLKKALSKVADSEKYLKGLEGKKVSTTDLESNKNLQEYIDNLKGADEATQEKARHLLALYNSTGQEKKTNREANIAEYGEDVIRWIEKPSEAVPASVNSLLRKMFKARLQEMSNAELAQAIRDINEIRKNGRTTRQAQVEKRAAELDELAAHIANDITTFTGKTPLTDVEKLSDKERGKSPLRKRADRILEAIDEYGYSMLDSERIIEGLVGFNKGSKIKDTLWTPLWRGTVEEIKGMKVAEKKFKDLFRKMNMAEVRTKPFIALKIKSPKTEQELTINLSLEEMMFVYANSQNPGNRAHLVGTGFTEEAIESVTGALPKEYKDAVDKLIDWYDEVQYPRVSAQFEREHLIPMPKEHRYFPLLNLNTDRGESQVVVDMMARMGAKKAGVLKGFTKSRVGADTPFSGLKFFDTVLGNIKAVEHYIAMAEPTREVQRVLNDKNVKAAIQAKSKPAYANLGKWVKALAYGKIEGGDKIMNVLRNNYAAYVLGYKLTSVMAQTGSLPKAMGQLNKARFAGTVGRWISNPVKFMENVNELSPFMDARSRSFERDIAEQFEGQWAKDMLGVGSLADKVRETGMWTMGAYDKLLASWVWDAKYRESLNRTGNKQQAVDDADELVRKTQSGGGLISMPEWHRGSALARMLSQFKSDPSKTVNLLYEMAGKVRDRGYAKTALDAFWVLLAPAMLEFMIRHGFRPPWDEPEEVAREVVNNVSGGIPYLGQVVEAAGNVAIDKIGEMRGIKPNEAWKRNIGEVSLPALQGISSLSEGLAGEKIWAIADGLAAVAGIPGGGQVKRTVQGAQKMAKGDVDIRGLVWSESALKEHTVRENMKRRLKSNKPDLSAEFLVWYGKQKPKKQEEFREYFGDGAQKAIDKARIRIYGNDPKAEDGNPDEQKSIGAIERYENDLAKTLTIEEREKVIGRRDKLLKALEKAR